MKSSSPVATPPLSPYGVFSGTLFQYSSSPSLIAFESLPPSAHINNDENISKKKCILIGGLSDGPIPTPYTKLLEEECHSLGWSLVQPVLSSSYLGFGHGSLSRDTCEIGKLLDYLVVHHDAEYFALVGHSTGCQNSIHFLKHGDNDVDNNYIADERSSSRTKRVKVVALQAPVSDRETDQDNSKYIQHAQQLVSQNQGDEMMPRSSFWAPITASRYISLFDKDGDDDFFSSDLTDEQLRERLGHVSRQGGSSELDVLAVYSGKDEYVPSFVDKDKLLKRMVDAMNDGGRCTNAKGLMLPNANHNLSKSEGDARTFVDAVGELLRKW
jgi:hypothetical protein